MQNSNDIKSALADDLANSSAIIDRKNVDEFIVEPEELDNRDDIGEYHISVGHGTRRPNISTGAFSPWNTIQEYIVQLYVQAHKLKGSEDSYADLFDDLNDDIFDWIKSLADGNRIYDVHSKLRVPRDDEGEIFSDQEEPLPINKSKYTRFHIETVRKS